MSARFAALLSCLVALVSLVTSGRALADARDPAAAEALFDEARALMKDGRFAQACPKLEASQKLDPGVGTLLNLGDCYEQLGRLATAWARYREAASAALSAGQSERERIAREHAAALQPRLSRLVLRVQEAAGGGGELVLARDGVALDRAAWGSAVPVDPGEHGIRASAPGKKTWNGVVVVPEAPQVVTFEVPPLEDEPAPSPAPSPVATLPGFDARTPAPEEKRGLGVQRGAALGTAGVGAVALFLAGGFALSARSTYADARTHCTSAGCDPDGVRMGHTAGVDADVATVSLVAGGVALAAATVLWLTAR
jgi:hypothetical protein